MEEILESQAKCKLFAYLYRSQVCIRCILRFFKVLSFDLYRERLLFPAHLSRVSEKLALGEELVASYLPQRQIRAEEGASGVCRACIGILQEVDTKDSIERLITQLKADDYEFRLFVFQIKLPLSISVRFVHILYCFELQVGLLPAELKELAALLEWKPGHVDVKAVVKWVLAPIISERLNAKATT